MHIDLDKVPLREPSMSPEEILASASPRSGCAPSSRPEHVDDFLAVCAKWDVLATVIGEVTDTGRLQVDWHGERIVDVPPRTVAHEGPVYKRRIQRPSRAGRIRQPSTGAPCPARTRAINCAPPCSN